MGVEDITPWTSEEFYRYFLSGNSRVERGYQCINPSWETCRDPFFIFYSLVVILALLLSVTIFVQSIREALKFPKFHLTSPMRFYFQIAASFAVAVTSTLFKSSNSTYAGPFNNFGAFLAFIAATYLIKDCKFILAGYGRKGLSIVLDIIRYVTLLVAYAFLFVNFLQLFYDSNNEKMLWVQRLFTNLISFLTNFAIAISLYLSFFYSNPLDGVMVKWYITFMGATSIVLGIASMVIIFQLVPLFITQSNFLGFSSIAIMYLTIENMDEVVGWRFQTFWYFYMIKTCNYLRSILTMIAIVFLEQYSNRLEKEADEELEHEHASALRQPMIADDDIMVIG